LAGEVEEEQEQQTHRKSKEDGSQPLRKEEGGGRRTTLESDSDTGAGMKAVFATSLQTAKKISCIAMHALILLSFCSHFALILLSFWKPTIYLGMYTVRYA